MAEPVYSFEHAIAAAAAKVLTAAGIPAVALSDASPKRSFPSVLVEPDDLDNAFETSYNDAGIFRMMLYLHCDTYLPDDANGAANASLVSLVRTCMFTGFAAQLAAEAANFAFYAVRPGKSYAADETDLRRITQEVEVIFTTATTTEEDSNAVG